MDIAGRIAVILLLIMVGSGISLLVAIAWGRFVRHGENAGERDDDTN